MNASNSNIGKLISIRGQYQIPLFQRSYTWERENWKKLWEDILSCLDQEEDRTHFLGAFVLANQTRGQQHLLVVDGQQRITTIAVILIVLRDLFLIDFQEDLNSIATTRNLLINNGLSNEDAYKFLPAQSDKKAFFELMEEPKLEHKKYDKNSSTHLLTKGYKFFFDRLKKYKKDKGERLRKVMNFILGNLDIVSIELDVNENYYIVYESLNATGCPLTQADLIKNHFFRKIPKEKQELLHNDYWQPMEIVFKEKESASNKDPLTEYLRCFLMQEQHEVIREKELFTIYRNKIKNPEQVTTYLEKLRTFLPYYERISEPQKETHPLLRKHLERMNKLENKNAYPLCLKCYAAYDQGNLTIEEFIQILNMLENFIIRRFVCGDYAYEHIRIFTVVVLQSLGELKHMEFVEMIRYKLASKKYRTDEEVKNHFLEKELYVQGSENKTRLILETLEEHLSVKQMTASAKPSIEHILPKNDDLKRIWKEHLGADWKAIHKKYVHTIGNLTLTYHNSALGEKSFDEKKEILSQYDYFALNKYFYQVSQWQENDIIERSKWLADEAIKIWKYFGHVIEDDEDLDVTGTKPKILTIYDKIIPVKSWREVLVETFNTIYDLDSEKFEKIANEYPKWIEKEGDSGDKGYLPLKKVGYYANVHHKANNIRNICEKAMDIIGFKQSWKVDLEEVTQEKNLFIS